jgi:hypothetical protein
MISLLGAPRTAALCGKSKLLLILRAYKHLRDLHALREDMKRGHPQVKSIPISKGQIFTS